MASIDPVALDQASIDIVNQQQGISGTMLEQLEPGGDKFRSMNGVDWSAQLKYGEKMGLGSRKYKIIKV